MMIMSNQDRHSLDRISAYGSTIGETSVNSSVVTDQKNRKV